MSVQLVGTDIRELPGMFLDGLKIHELYLAQRVHSWLHVAAIHCSHLGVICNLDMSYPFYLTASRNDCGKGTHLLSRRLGSPTPRVRQQPVWPAPDDLECLERINIAS